MNWLERARFEFSTAPGRTAIRADRTPTAVMAVPVQADSGTRLAAEEKFEERAGIMEFDGGLSRQDAERAAHALVYGCKRNH